MKMLVLEVGPLSTNCYILAEGASACVIDPGYEGGRIISELEKLKAVPELILLTHGHFDHVSAVGELKRKYPGIKTYIHSDDSVMMKSGELSYADEFATKVDPLTKADVLLSDGDEVKWGDAVFKTLHTPGHTPGSVCFFSADVMFSGDTLFKQSIGTTSLYGGDTETMYRSLDRLKELEKDYTVFPGHGGQTTLFEEKKNNPFLTDIF